MTSNTDGKMTTEKEAKNLGLELYLRGKSTDAIALECGVARRTIQRWIKEFEQTPIKVTVQESVADKKQESVSDKKQESVIDEKQDVGESIKQEILPVLEKIASPKQIETLDLKITSKLAIKLLNLTESAMNSVGNCLIDPDTKTSDKLKAAQLVGSWLGLDRDESVIRKLSRNFELEIEIANSDTADTTLTPNRLADVRREQQEILETERETYNNDIYYEFIETGKLPTIFEEIFDWDSFWQNLKELDEDENTQHVAKAKVILRERNS